MVSSKVIKASIFTVAAALLMVLTVDTAGAGRVFTGGHKCVDQHFLRFPRRRKLGRCD